VRALRRPPVPAAAVNRAVRAEPAQARALLDAADDLRRAHEAVLGGEADRDALRAAVAAERQAVGALAATAVAEAGGAVSADVERRIRDTLEAVALDSQVRERFATGTLESDARAAGLAADLAGAAPAPPRDRRARGGDEARRKAEQERERRRLEAALRRAEAEVERRRADVAAAEQARESANAALRDARKRLRVAEAELRRARRAGP